MQRDRVVLHLSVNTVDVINQIFLYATKVSVTLEQEMQGAKRGKMVLILEMVAGAGMDDEMFIALHALRMVHAAITHSVNTVDVISRIFLYVMKVSVTLEQEIKGATREKMVMT